MEKLYKFQDGCLQRLSDKAWIPSDEKNRDYAEFLILCDQYGASEITEE